MVDGPASEQPCAVLLTDEQGHLNLVVSDLHRDYGDGYVVRDTGQLTGRLEQLRMWRTVARSKPSGARHAWLSLTEPTDADLLGALADHTAALLPTPDVAPLRNSAWAAVRPLGALHSFGGCSVILTGSAGPLRAAVTS